MTDRIGILGGTFNPIHLGHVRLGLEVTHHFGLDRVMYILSAKPPHKTSQNIVPVDLRWQMLTMTLEIYPGLIPSDIEIKRPYYSWTIDTINELKKKNPSDQFFFISGSECFLKIKTWKNYQSLLRSVSFVIVLRSKGHKKDVITLLKEEKINVMEYSGIKPAPQGVYIFQSKSDILSISSTFIRNNLKNKIAVDDLINHQVLEIIKEYKLYEG